MKIAIDLRPLQGAHQYRGIGKYIASMLPELFRLAPDDEFVCYYWGQKPPKLAHGKNVRYVRVAGDRTISLNRYVSWLGIRHLGIVQPIRADVFLQPDVFFGLKSGLPNVTVLYDLIPLIFHDRYFSLKDSVVRLRAIKQFKTEQNLRIFKRVTARYEHVSHIVSISEASLKDLHRLYPKTKQVPATVTPLAAQPLPVATGKRPYKSSYAIYVGGADARKNIVGLIEAFDLACSKGSSLDLVLVGNDFLNIGFPEMPSIMARIDASPYKQRIHLKGYVSDKELALLYKYASVCSFASLYEGFGMPVLEAMHAGVPVVAYRNSSIPEIADGVAMLADTPAEFARALTKLSHDKALQTKLARLGKSRAKEFTWTRTAELTLLALHRAANKN